jgi:hypothetical protein
MGFIKDLFGFQKTTNTKREQNSIGDIFKDLFNSVTTEQRLAILGFESSIISFAQGMTERQEALKLIEYEMKALNISESQFIAYAQRGGHNRMQDIVDGLLPINNKAVLDNTLYTSFGIASVCKNEKALGYLVHVFGQLGYTEDDIKNVIQKMELLGKQFGI